MKRETMKRVSWSDVNVKTTRPRVHNFKEKLWEVKYTWPISDLLGPLRPRIHNLKEKILEVRYTWPISDLLGPLRPRVHKFKEKLWEFRYTWPISSLQGPHLILFDAWFILLVCDFDVSPSAPIPTTPIRTSFIPTGPPTWSGNVAQCWKTLSKSRKWPKTFFWLFGSFKNTFLRHLNDHSWSGNVVECWESFSTISIYNIKSIGGAKLEKMTKTCFYE